MTGTEIRETVLSNVRDELAALQPELERDKRRRLILSRRGRLIYDAAHKGLIEYAPARWLGRALTGAERAAFCRELEQMQADGLIERVNMTAVADRTTHIRICSAPNKSTDAPA